MRSKVNEGTDERVKNTDNFRFWRISIERQCEKDKLKWKRNEEGERIMVKTQRALWMRGRVGNRAIS